jgi:hypothetical protein
MVNAWSLAWDALNGTMDEDIPSSTLVSEQVILLMKMMDLIYENDYYDQYWNEQDIWQMWTINEHIILQMQTHHIMMGGQESIIKNN